MAKLKCLIRVNYSDHDEYMPGDIIEDIGAEDADYLEYIGAGELVAVEVVEAPVRIKAKKEAD